MSENPKKRLAHPLAVTAVAALLASAGCRGDREEPRTGGPVSGPITDETLDFEEGEGTSLRKPESNVQQDQVQARVVLRPTQGNDVKGEFTLGPAEEGVQLVGTLSGLRPTGSHAIHVHEKGDCSAPDAESAGPHFNPEGEEHGRAFHGEHHVGDMDNIRANDAGEARVERIVVGATLGDGGPNDIAGRALVVHVGPDDYRSQPSGGAGDRAACGVIELTHPPK